MSIPRNSNPAVAECPIVQYANSATRATLSGAKRASDLVGFHVEVGRDEGFDRLAHAEGIERITIHHPREGRQPEDKQHWFLGEAFSFYPVTAGPPANKTAALSRVDTAGAGLGWSWPPNGRSKLAVRGYVAMGGSALLVQFSAKSTFTDHLLAALIDHVRVAVAADELVDRARHPEPVGCYELLLTLKAGEEVTAGKKETKQVVKYASTHPAELSREYIAGIWRPSGIAKLAEDNWDAIVAWAADFAQGVENAENAEPIADY